MHTIYAGFIRVHRVIGNPDAIPVDKEVASVGDSLEELRQQLKQDSDGQALILEITQRIATGGSLAALLQDIVDAIRRVSHADGIRIVLTGSGDVTAYADGSLAVSMAQFDKSILELVSQR